MITHSQQRRNPRACSWYFPRKDAINHASQRVASEKPLQRGRTKPSVWLCRSPGLPWWPPADHIWNQFPLEKATQIEPPVPRTGPRDVAWEAHRGGHGGHREGPSYPTRRVNLSQGSTSSAEGIATFFFFLNNLTQYFNKSIKESISIFGNSLQYMFQSFLLFSHKLYLTLL